MYQCPKNRIKILFKSILSIILDSMIFFNFTMMIFLRPNFFSRKIQCNLNNSNTFLVSPISTHNHSNCSDHPSTSSSNSDTTYYHLSHPSSSSSGINNGGNMPWNGAKRNGKRAKHNKTSHNGFEHGVSLTTCSINDNTTLSRSIASAAAPHRSIPEVFLTRLLMCKGTVQRFVEAFFGG